MRRIYLVAALLVSACCGFAQQVETSRFEVDRWSKDQSCRFVSFGEQGGMMVSETNKFNEEKQQLWDFTTLDTSLYDLKSDLIPLPEKLELFDAKSSDRWAAFVFLNEKKQKSDSVTYWVTTYNRGSQEFNTFSGRLPERSTLQSIALIDGTLMFSVNGRTGNGFLAQFDLDNHTQRTITPALSNDYVLFQLVPMPASNWFRCLHPRNLCWLFVSLWKNVTKPLVSMCTHEMAYCNNRTVSRMVRMPGWDGCVFPLMRRTV